MSHEPSSTKARSAVTEYVEDVLGQLLLETPAQRLCWIVCADGCPVQSRPPESKDWHLMIFGSEELANKYIRCAWSNSTQCIQAIAVDSALTLKRLAAMPARYEHYCNPPQGLWLNDVPDMPRDRTMVLTAAQVLNCGEAELTAKLSLGAGSMTSTVEQVGASSAQSCPICGHPLYKGDGAILIGFGDAIFDRLDQRSATSEHTAYACRQCGHLVCKTCAQKNSCPACGNNTFDRFDLAGR